MYLQNHIRGNSNKRQERNWHRASKTKTDYIITNNEVLIIIDHYSLLAL